jgi:phosphoglycolate phosphatase-like HAD superfamily hydrolase
MTTNKDTHLILFDLDGTLLDVFEEHAASLERAVKDVWGIPVLLPDHKRYGIPQKQTIRNVCEASNLNAADIADKLPIAMDIMTEVMSQILPQDLSGRCLPGSNKLLGKLESMANVHLVIATGTLGATAEMLLERSGLRKYFPTGAYGHECASREQLVVLARERGLEFYDLHPDGTYIATIGDAPSDILAGKSIDAYTISVATSLFDVDALRQFEPDVVLEGLHDTELVIHRMLRMSG